MLVLSRKVGEKIIIGDNVEVEVTAVSGSRVRIGITAPAHVPIMRSELTPREPATPRPAAEPNPLDRRARNQNLPVWAALPTV